jgi:hypothetical protein
MDLDEVANSSKWLMASWKRWESTLTLKRLLKLVVRIHGHSLTAIDVVENTSKSELSLFKNQKLFLNLSQAKPFS